MIGLVKPPSRSSDVSTPSYQVVIDYIESGIKDGTYPVGSKLPTIVELSTLTRANQTAVKTALLILNQRGTVRGEQGRGSFVAEPPADRSPEQ